MQLSGIVSILFCGGSGMWKTASVGGATARGFGLLG